MLAEILPFDGQTRESWVLDLERLKEKLHSAVHVILQTLRAVSNYHQYYNKASFLEETSKWSCSVLIAVVFCYSLETHQLQCHFIGNFSVIYQIKILLSTIFSNVKICNFSISHKLNAFGTKQTYFLKIFKKMYLYILWEMFYLICSLS